MCRRDDDHSGGEGVLRFASIFAREKGGTWGEN
jgi:hypothetical protein